MSYVSRNPRKVLAGLTTSLVAIGVAVGSGATFTSHSANPTNTFTAGTLLHTNSKADQAVIATDTNLKPGDVRTGTVTIKNTGTLAGKFTLSEKNAANGFGAGDFKVKIEDLTAGTTIYNDDLGKVPAAGIALGTFAKNEAHDFRFTATLIQAAPDADQGKTATADYEWDAVSS